MFIKLVAVFCLLASSLASSLPGEIHRKSNLQTAKFIKETPTQKIGSLVIERHSSEFCQIRVDFNTFESVGQINRRGLCEGGQWTLKGQIQKNIPTLCGYNTGQHVYADFDENGSPIWMNVTVDDEEAEWDITVTQIGCDDEENRVGVTCTQSYKSVNGNFQSLGYQNIQTNNPPVTYQLANQDYYICFGPTTNSYTSNRFSRGTGAFDFYFSITGLVSVTPTVYIGTNLVADFDTTCTTDYVGITSGAYTDINNAAATSSKFCGLGFPVTVTTTVKPFTLHVYTDGTESPQDDGNVGFSLFYQLS